MEVVICLLFVAYLLPFAVAARHEHERLGWILAANFLVGWTIIGWFLVLRWARRPAPPPAEPVARLRRGHLRLLEPPEGARDVPRLRPRRAIRGPRAERLSRPRA